MALSWTLSLIEVRSSPPRSGRCSVKLWAQQPAYRWSIIPKPTLETEQANQDLESALHCVMAHHASSWSSHLPWIEYAHNYLVSSVTGMKPFMASMGFQLPLFPAQQEEVAALALQNQRIAGRH